MAGLKTIKTKIRSIEKTQTVTKAMEAVSASKMRKAQQKALAGRAYARAAVSILSRVSGSRELANHPLVRGAERLFSEASPLLPAAGENNFSASRALYIVITSDKGLAGALNSAVLRKVHADSMFSGLAQEKVSIIAVGRKANDFFVARGFAVESYHPNTDVLTPEFVAQLVDEAASAFNTGAVDVVKIAYQNFVSTFEQRPTLRTIFPLSLDELQQVVSDIVPARGVFAPIPPSGRDLDQKVSTYSLEPSEVEVLDAILPRLASIFVYHALLEAQASEHSARMVSMKSASDKAGEMEHDLTLQFNKARQAAITREVSEITGGMEAMAA
ncbi:MAG: ATP synthase F1 subunit gamma [bacterium]|nr:ATP synthase F1 subunit gamma [bacterium]